MLGYFYEASIASKLKCILVVSLYPLVSRSWSPIRSFPYIANVMLLAHLLQAVR